MFNLRLVEGATCRFSHEGKKSAEHMLREWDGLAMLRIPTYGEAHPMANSYATVPQSKLQFL